MPRASRSWRELRHRPTGLTSSSGFRGPSGTGWSELQLAGPASRQRPGFFSWCLSRETGFWSVPVSIVLGWPVSCVKRDLMFVCIAAFYIMLWIGHVFVCYAGALKSRCCDPALLLSQSVGWFSCLAHDFGVQVANAASGTYSS